MQAPRFKLFSLCRPPELVQPTLLKSIRFCFIDVRWLLTAFDFQILKTTTCTLSYKTLKILSTFCSLVWKIRENLKNLFSKIWPDRTDSCNIMCIWVKSPGEFKNLDLSKVNEHRTSSSLLESLKLSHRVLRANLIKLFRTRKKLLQHECLREWPDKRCNPSPGNWRGTFLS